jgi:ribulose-phosphate 3-epimerase
MIEKPERFIETFARAGGNWITVHVEVCPQLSRIIKRIRKLNMRPGVVLNPSTPLKTLYSVLNEIDLVLLMSVNPGFAGQSFIPSTLKKIEKLRKIIDRSGHPVEIEVDGGIKADNVGEVARAGGDIFVSGSGIFKTKDYGETIQRFRREIA